MKSKRAREDSASADKGKNAVDALAEEPPVKKRKSDGDVKLAKDKDKKDKSDKSDKKDKKNKKESRKERKYKRKDLQNLPKEDDAEPIAVDEDEAPVAAAPLADAVNGCEKKDGNGVKKRQKNKKQDKKSVPDAEEAAALNGDGKDAGKDAGEEASASSKKSRRDKKDKKEQKPSESQRQRKQGEADRDDTDGQKNEDAEGADSKAGKKGSKRGKDKDKKKDKKGAKEANKDNKYGEKDGQEAKKDGATQAGPAAKADRHIVFVGNLPYTATTASVTEHFVALAPAAVRCLTAREGGSCRGTAFVEFASVASQRTCLDRFHHSLFDDGLSPARKINVELTAGGGSSKSTHRKDKIRAKNAKLDQNRARRIEREKAAKGDAASGPPPAEDPPQGMGDSTHPSRLARNPRLGH